MSIKTYKDQLGWSYSFFLLGGLLLIYSIANSLKSSVFWINSPVPYIGWIATISLFVFSLFLYILCYRSYEFSKSTLRIKGIFSEQQIAYKNIVSIKINYSIFPLLRNGWVSSNYTYSIQTNEKSLIFSIHQSECNAAREIGKSFIQYLPNKVQINSENRLSEVTRLDTKETFQIFEDEVNKIKKSG